MTPSADKTATKSSDVGESFSFEHLEVERWQVNEESAPPPGSRNIKMTSLASKAAVDMPMNMSHNRVAIK